MSKPHQETVDFGFNDANFCCLRHDVSGSPRMTTRHLEGGSNNQSLTVRVVCLSVYYQHHRGRGALVPRHAESTASALSHSQPATQQRDRSLLCMTWQRRTAALSFGGVDALSVFQLLSFACWSERVDQCNDFLDVKFFLSHCCPESFSPLPFCSQVTAVSRREIPSVALTTGAT